MTMRLPAIAASVALIAALAGCSSTDNAAACKEMETTMAGVAQRLAAQFDPASVEKVYSEEAASLRRIADDKAGGDVQSAAQRLADSLEKLGHDIASSPTRPSPDALTSAADQLQQACT